MVTAVTIGLFSLIGWRIEEFYFRYVVISGLAAVPIVATFLPRPSLPWSIRSLR
jgi:hypothetical protein